jgi:hypothetical protein
MIVSHPKKDTMQTGFCQAANRFLHPKIFYGLTNRADNAILSQLLITVLEF